MKVFQSTDLTPVKLTLYTSKVQAGFPSPAENYIDVALDLNEYLISHPSSSFFVRATGDSMVGAGIRENSLLVVDRSKEPLHNKIVIAVVNGEFTVKRLKITKKGLYLIAEHPDYLPMKVNEDSYIWGVVTAIINKL